MDFSFCFVFIFIYLKTGSLCRSGTLQFKLALNPQKSTYLFFYVLELKVWTTECWDRFFIRDMRARTKRKACLTYTSKWTPNKVDSPTAYIFIVNESIFHRARLVAKQLRALAASSENWSSVPSTHWQLTVVCNQVIWCPLRAFACTELTWCTDIHANETTMQIKWIFLKDWGTW